MSAKRSRCPSSPGAARPGSVQAGRQPAQGELFPPESREIQIGFTTRLLVATTLPHSRSEDNELTRSSGLYDLCLLAPRRVGLPFGRYPRLAFVWIITEAVRRQTPMLHLPHTFTQFAQELGITPSSGPKGTLVQLREQLHRLVNVTFSCLGAAPAEHGRSLSPAFYEGGGIHPIKRYLLWWDEPRPDVANPSFLLLNEDFFQEIVAHPIPVSLAVLRTFRSPLEMDVYVWLTWRSLRTLRLQRPELVSWPALKNQFGSSYAEERSFRYHFLRAVKQVLCLYPEIRLKSTRRGLILLPYPPHVAHRVLPVKTR
ncbi:MAG TPA: replication protein RepA [Thermoanaerobaculia bacterium]|nr:replication protein RepA [Thermoanaerobaculia bacterium]